MAYKTARRELVVDAIKLGKDPKASPSLDEVDAGVAPDRGGVLGEGTGDDVSDRSTRLRFEALVLSHLDAAYNLARWLVRNDSDANDIVQDAFLRAFCAFKGFRGDNARPWLLAIVRNTAFTWLHKNRPSHLHVAYEESIHDEVIARDGPEPETPEHHALRTEDRRAINDALARLPIELREAVVLRELEELSYREIATVQAIPIGTVMSRLSRGRQLLGRYLRQATTGGGHALR
jgi:RNA polymerase sigma-70 factor (ECF subfamily)